eukprot:Rmarinus@m.29963
MSSEHSAARSIENEEIAEAPGLFLNFVSEEMSCKICSHIALSWMMLPCDHIYCEACTSKLSEKYGSSTMLLLFFFFLERTNVWYIVRAEAPQSVCTLFKVWT